MPNDGHEIAGASSGSPNEALFADLSPGTYTVEASAPGFLAIRRRLRIEEGVRALTLFLFMKPESPPASSAVAESAASAADLSRASWPPPDVDRVVPPVQRGVKCHLPQVVSRVGARMKELVDNLQKVDATENVEHFDFDASGLRGRPETRTFDYVMTITRPKKGGFALEEYRNNSTDPAQFPAHTATTGLSALALLLHPTFVSDFYLACEGLGRWDGHPAWQIHFEQRIDRPSRIEFYRIANDDYPMPLKGRVWIDAATFQVLRLESQMVRPIPFIGLTQDYMAIDYGPVQFQTHKQELWLPLDADVYFEGRGQRFYRRHTLSNFKIFGVETTQQIQDLQESYCFTNKTNHEISGILSVSPVSGASAKAVSLRFTISPGQKVCKLIGPGKDINMRANEVGSATFTFNAPAGSIAALANVYDASPVDLVPDNGVAPSSN